MVTDEELKNAINNYQDKADQFVFAAIESSAKEFESRLIIIGFILSFSSLMFFSPTLKNAWLFVIVFFASIIIFFLIYLFYRNKISKLYGAIVGKYMAIGGIPKLDRDYSKPLDYKEEIIKAKPKMEEEVKKIEKEHKNLNFLEKMLNILSLIILIFFMILISFNLDLI